MTITDTDIDGYRAFVGRETTATCTIAPDSADLMAATLDRADPPAGPGDPLPPMWLPMAFRPDARRSRIGPDGHPLRGDFLPPVALPRRMFGGARLRYLAPLPVGVPITRLSRIASVEAKRGGSGLMVFVTVTQTYSADGTACVAEEQDIIYREAAAPGAPTLPPAPEKPLPEAPWAQTWHPDPVTLFRYSALTFNGHRIHYDRSYATGEEGYPGLVVHGPLTALLLAELCRSGSGDRPLAAFGFRARSPLFDTGPVHLRGTPSVDNRNAALGAYDPRGQLAMSAEAVFR
jgi:3-methylfumaryl-CoA hydratase